MFLCENIDKSYGNVNVLRNFTYSFPKTGFVLLYGESGCGKTTLLNILAGLIPFDKGSVVFQGKAYVNQIDITEISEYIGYITQDTHFIDYLTVFDNLRLCSTDDENIISFLSEFGLIELKDNYPATLSGGEKQRLAILQALLAEKDIIILDEPTSSLDIENKKKVFQTLERLKVNKLIICSSHDSEAKNYADELIDFNDLEHLEIYERSDEKIISDKKEKGRRKLKPFFNKWYTYKGREKKSKVQFLIVIILSFLAICICDTPQHKLDSNVEYTYKLNQFKVCASEQSKKNEELLKAFKNNKDIIETDLLYNMSVPIKVKEGSIEISSDYDLTADTLPFDKRAFKLSNRVKYGTYFTNENQIMLSAEKAKEMGNPEKLIGDQMKINLYDKTYNMEIIGIFDTFTKNEKQYLRASGILNEGAGNYFLNGKFTNRYMNDKGFYMYGNRTYTVYFNSFHSMKMNYEHYKEVFSSLQFSYAEIDVNLLFLFQYLFYILLPIVLTILPISLLFYYQMQKIEFSHNRHIFSVYQYLGYSIKEIKKCLVIGNIIETVKITLKAIIIALPVMIAINFINSKLLIVPFEIFTYNIYLIFVLAAFIVVLSILLSLQIIRKIKNTGWYQVLIEQRDLI